MGIRKLRPSGSDSEDGTVPGKVLTGPNLRMLAGLADVLVEIIGLFSVYICLIQLNGSSMTQDLIAYHTVLDGQPPGVQFDLDDTLNVYVTEASHPSTIVYT